MPSPMAKRIGNTKIQKIASGSRRIRRNRTTVSSYRLLSLSLFIAQVPPRQANKHIFESRRVCAEFAQMQSLAGERGKNARNGDMQLAHRELMQARANTMRLDSRNCRQQDRIHRA